ncbi:MULTISPECIES: hypothetical protein [unclassified Caballeronia]|uniref:hypothetical protein n=1 Tax=unclassified Caballeronia TaxID=2646786 RepID=UPI002029616D|nr:MULTISPECIES: hypothetical protein [unclassified Caballeronia]MDR5786009.1 hypothetical protein [Caballeronia sp. LP003]
MTRFVRTARRRFGPVSSKIADASRHFVPPKLSSWKLALYLIVFLLPGGSFVVLGMGWFENRQRRKAAAAPAKAPARPLLSAPCSPCPGSGR